MRPVDEHPRIATCIRTLRIIVIALCLGLGVFLVITWLRTDPGEGLPPGEEPDELLAWIALAFLGLMTPVWLVLRAVLMRRARDAYSRDDIEGFCQKFQAATITLCALLEGVGFFGAVGWMISGSEIALGVALTCLIGMLSQMPSTGRVNGLLEDAP